MSTIHEQAIVLEERVRIPADVFELTGYRAWAHSDQFPQTGKVAFIAGEVVVDMSPEEIESHAKVKRDIVYGLCKFLEQLDLGDLLPDGTLLVNEEAQLSTEPDVMLSRWESLESGQVRYAERDGGSGRLMEVLGAPDVVVEIVSRYSVRKDTVLLFERYYRAGIAEYWLIDARSRDVEFEIFTRGGSQFEPMPADADGFRVSPTLGHAFQIVRETDRMRRARYRLMWRS